MPPGGGFWSTVTCLMACTSGSARFHFSVAHINHPVMFCGTCGAPGVALGTGAVTVMFRMMVLPLTVSRCTNGSLGPSHPHSRGKHGVCHWLIGPRVAASPPPRDARAPG